MLNKTTNYINLISIIIIIYLAFIPLKPHNIKQDSFINGEFSIQAAYDHVNKLASVPHITGSNKQRKNKAYIIRQLKNLGLKVSIQKTNSVTSSKWNNRFSNIENIFATIEGTDKSRKSLVIMSHYDSALFDSKGAADAASGVAVVLEGARALLNSKIKPKNDIIILITDGEETGLFGARAFVNKGHLTKNIGAVINFEARGTSGSAYMFMETNGGNHNMLESFKDAQVSTPNSNSLAYSIYKMLPNDTDLTVFREDANISGFNFAFIDSHYNYHTQRDDINNLSLDSLAHQASYLMPLLHKLSQDDLSKLSSKQDDVYFQIPFWKTVNYPFSWAIIISLINLVFFVLIVIVGIKNKTLEIKPILSASLPLVKSAIITALLSFSILKFLYWLHPQYDEILQGFTYNGHRYILFFSLLAVSVCYFFYKNVQNKFSSTTLLVMPVLIWILISIGFALFLTGAHFFVIISILGTISLAINVITKKPQPNVTLFLALPVIIIFTPFFVQLPVALGMALLPFSGVLLVLILSTFITSIQIPSYFQLNRWLFITPLIAIFIWTEMSASTSNLRPLPNSLYYFQNQEDQNAYLFTADNMISDWNKELLREKYLKPKELEEFQKSNWRRAKRVVKTENRNFKVATIEVVKQRTYSNKKKYTLKLTTKRKVDVININVKSAINIAELTINKESIISQNPAKLQKENTRLATIYTTNNSNYTIEIDIAPEEFLDLEVIEISHDLLKSKKFNIPERPKHNIPKPFIYSDSIITKQKVRLN